MNTLENPVDWRTNWPVRPALPDPPRSGPPGVWERYEAEVAQWRAMFQTIQDAKDRSQFIRDLLFAGWTARQTNLPELERLSAIGREFEAAFPGVQPDQMAKVVDLLLSRLGSQITNPTEAPQAEPTQAAPMPAAERSARIASVVSAMPETDPLAGELG